VYKSLFSRILLFFTHFRKTKKFEQKVAISLFSQELVNPPFLTKLVGGLPEFPHELLLTEFLARLAIWFADKNLVFADTIEGEMFYSILGLLAL
jgi:hypothetical protein